MAGIPAPTQAAEEVNHTWLRVTQALALLSAAAVAGGGLVWLVRSMTGGRMLDAIGLASLLVFLLPPVAVCLGIYWCLRRRHLRLGLAIGVSTGLMVTAVTALLLLVAAAVPRSDTEYINERGPSPLAIFFVLFVLTQIALVASAALTYYSMDRQPQDRRILLKGLLISLAALWGGEILCSALYVLLLGVLALSHAKALGL